MEGKKSYQSSEDLREENFSFEDQSGNSWPEKNYGCSFCKREFKSAQALGGHMNVHRRDRARLRSTLPLTSWLADNNPKPNSRSPKPNPNLQYSSSSSASEVFSYTPYYPICNNSPCLSLSSSPASTSEGKLPLLSSQSNETKMNKNIYTRNAFGIEQLKGFSKEDHEEKICKNENGIELGSGVGFLEDPKEQIDLELRLGNS